MIERGKWVILLIFGLAAAATAFSWWYHVQRGDRALQFWGRQAAIMIRHAPQVELALIDPVQGVGVTDRARVVQIGGRDFVVKDRREISQAPGMLHARQALIEDASFAWADSPGHDVHDWRFVLQFSQRGELTTIALDSGCRHALFCQKGRQVSVGPIASGLQTFIHEQLQGQRE